MTNDMVKKAFQEAAEIASELPKHLQEVAFNRALDHLLGKRGSDVRREPISPHSPRRHQSEGDEQSEFAKILNSIDRTQLPDVGSTSRVADRALKVLEFINDKCGLDGLSALQISEILTKKFRLPISTNSVNMALERETSTVDVRRTSNGVKVFHLMAAGEDYLKSLRSGEALPRRRRASATAAGKRKADTQDHAIASAAPKAKSASGEQKRKSSRPGPKAAIGQLIAAGFFKTARLITEIQSELKHKRGHTYSVQELAPALVRSLRDDSLSRTRNASGQYEYTKA